jgi:hypothetical protein
VDNIVDISNLLLTIVLIFVWGTLAIFVVIGSILAKMYENRFFSAVKAVLNASEFDLGKAIDSIKNSYAVYRAHRFGFANKKIIAICQELSMNLRNAKGLDSVKFAYKDLWAGRLDDVIKQLQYEEAFDDEKANEIVAEVKGSVSNDIVEKVRRKLVFLEAYHKGVVSVKNAEIQELKDKESRDKLSKGIVGTLGVVGSVASIISLFIK